jgi:hypothetical protein
MPNSQISRNLFVVHKQTHQKVARVDPEPTTLVADVDRMVNSILQSQQVARKTKSIASRPPSASASKTKAVKPVAEILSAIPFGIRGVAMCSHCARAPCTCRSNSFDFAATLMDEFKSHRKQQSSFSEKPEHTDDVTSGSDFVRVVHEAGDASIAAKECANTAPMRQVMIQRYGKHSAYSPDRTLGLQRYGFPIVDTSANPDPDTHGSAAAFSGPLHLQDSPRDPDYSGYTFQPYAVPSSPVRKWEPPRDPLASLLQQVQTTPSTSPPRPTHPLNNHNNPMILPTRSPPRETSSGFNYPQLERSQEKNPNNVVQHAGQGSSQLYVPRDLAPEVPEPSGEREHGWSTQEPTRRFARSQSAPTFSLSPRSAINLSPTAVGDSFAASKTAGEKGSEKPSVKQSIVDDAHSEPCRLSAGWVQVSNADEEVCLDLDPHAAARKKVLKGLLEESRATEQAFHQLLKTKHHYSVETDHSQHPHPHSRAFVVGGSTAAFQRVTTPLIPNSSPAAISLLQQRLRLNTPPHKDRRPDVKLGVADQDVARTGKATQVGGSKVTRRTTFAPQDPQLAEARAYAEPRMRQRDGLDAGVGLNFLRSAAYDDTGSDSTSNLSISHPQTCTSLKSRQLLQRSQRMHSLLGSAGCMAEGHPKPAQHSAALGSGVSSELSTTRPSVVHSHAISTRATSAALVAGVAIGLPDTLKNAGQFHVPPSRGGSTPLVAHAHAHHARGGKSREATSLDTSNPFVRAKPLQMPSDRSTSGGGRGNSQLSLTAWTPRVPTPAATMTR